MEQPTSAALSPKRVDGEVGMSSDEESLYSEESDGYTYDAISDDGDMGFDSHAEVETSHRKAQYYIFGEEQLKERQQEALNLVTGVLSISEGEAVRVLRLYKWDTNRVNEEWFSDMYGVREKVGLFDEQPGPSASGKIKCTICFEEFWESEMCAAACKHHFCKDCWAGYVSSAIGSGPSCLNLRCPVPNCNAAVPKSVVVEVANQADQERYNRYALRSFVEDNGKLEWCPAPGCEHAVECSGDVTGEALDIMCKCGCAFCFNCKEEAHRPVDCATVKKWVIKNSAESENLNWILANTKPCPKCKRPIEKNQGCMHMTCSQCRLEFCWLCLGSWADHGERTGGFYACNRYEVAKQKGEYDEEAQKREHAKNALERYMHYYQRWAENDKARQDALGKLHKCTEEKLEVLSNMYATPTSQLKFVTDAWAQVVECRRILKWTYAYGYYNFDESITKRSSPEVVKQQQDFFEFNQGQAELFLEQLHDVLEKTLEAHLQQKASFEDWHKFRENLIGLTDVTGSHFDKLVQELEKGMDTMLRGYTEDGDTEDMQEATSRAAGVLSAQFQAARAKEEKKEKAKTRAARPSKRTRAAQRSAASAAGGSEDAGLDLLDMDSDAEEAAGFWQCRSCTFANTDLAATECEVCQNPRSNR